MLIGMAKNTSLDWLDWLSIIGTTFSIIGVGITIYLAITTQNIKDKVKVITNLKTFQKDKKTLTNELRSCKDIMENNLDNGIQDLSRIIRQLDEYTSFMSKDDLNNLKKIKRMIRSPKKRNVEGLLICVNHLIGFLELNIDITYKNI
ncbi:hypothetical protein QIX46_00460 [Lysinibacillus boronitolerans]|nr:hypothetical protein QIX46_00460 [Lysinibacillus boronitolerans]